MVTVGVRELKQQASEMVRETGNQVQVTYHGEVITLLLPVKQIKKRIKMLGQN